MKTALEEEKKQYTYEDYLAITDDKRYEIIDGGLFMVPAPNTKHQDISGNLEFFLRKFVKDSGLGKVFDAPTDVILSDDIVLQPDILFISKDRKEIIKKKGIFGSPDLVIEIVSPSTFVTDTITKKEIYEKFEVEEYWLVFPEDTVIEVFTIEEKKYVIHSHAVEKGKTNSKLLQGFEVDLKDIFEETKVGQQ